MKTNDITTEFVRASGPGGQHRNKATTGVRLTHTPTGVQATATERRSRSANHKVALRRLARRVAEATAVVAPRIPTKVPVRVKARRREDKRRQAQRKADRRSVRM
jgi:protein subunit release factor B